jgi:hypothetical protein
MKNSAYNPTMMIKSKFSNQVHRLLEPNIDVKKSDRWRGQYRERYKLTNEEKVKIFDEIVKLHQECSNELTDYQFERREKRRIHKARLERGYFEKKSEKSLKNQ